jgi:hypothetical protein
MTGAPNSILSLLRLTWVSLNPSLDAGRHGSKAPLDMAMRMTEPQTC